MKLISAALLSTLFLLAIGCDDNSTDPGEDYIIPTIRQPQNGAVISDSLYTILVDADQNCGCTSYMEFFVDTVHVHTDYIREFSFIMHTDEWQGEHDIIVHAVVPGSGYPNGIKAEGWDTVRVKIEL